ncbi:molecular chaperone [Acinetobacter sp. 'aerobic (ED)']|uniref:fimbrial biogenesis chaperone n=1 Tax=Acinetobacter sp. 'aerobic (ED)' TaxID=174230 RepID=UPI001D0E700D|nr:molecular chaperone [Acinetobacter sp. 'aerobic (ED)']
MAGILAEKTRIIFVNGQSSKNIMLANTNEYPVMLQTWVDRGEGNPDATDIPFVALPPVVRIKQSSLQSVRIVSNGSQFPAEKESVFWLNLYEIPAIRRTDKENESHYMSLSMNTQIKIFYRPKGLKPLDVSTLAKELKFSLKKKSDRVVLECANPTAYHASLINLQLLYGNNTLDINDEMDLMCYPKSKREYYISRDLPVSSNYILNYTLVDDLGVYQEFNKVLVLD